MKRGMCLEEDMQKVFAKLEELTKTEDWKILVDGIKYRRIGTDVEISVGYWTEIELKSWSLLEMGRLPEGYRPFTNITFPVVAKTPSGNTNLAVVLEVHSDGVVALQNMGTTATVHPILGFIKYSILKPE